MGKTIFLLGVLLCIFLNTFSQTKTISGKVTDSKGNPLSNVEVKIKGTNTSAITDESGIYTVEVQNGTESLEFVLPGMKPSSATIGIVDEINVIMVASRSDEMPELSLEDLMNIKIEIASSDAVNIFNTASTVSVIDSKTIEAYKFRSIEEALQTVPGMDIYRTYLKRNIPTARGVLQDQYANKVLIMINGVPTWNAVTGEGNLDRINIQDVDRIEVLKGPSSVLYGSNAFSGAVNIVLKKSAEYVNSTFGYAGNDGKLGAGSQVLLKTGTGNLFLSGNIDTESGHSYLFHDELDSTGKLKEFIKTRNFTASFQDKSYQFLINYYHVDESYLGVTPSFSAGAGNAHELKGFLASFSTAFDLAKFLKVKYFLNYDWNYRDLSRSANDNIRARVDGYRLVNQASLLLSPKEELTFELGGTSEYKLSKSYENYFVPTDTVITGNNMAGIDQYTYAAFGEFSFHSGNYNLTMGSRFTHNSLFKSNLSSRITFVYKLGDKSSLKALYGESFRAPSLFEQNFTTTTYTVVGNPDLVPEKNRSVELLYVHSFAKVFLQATLYHAIYDKTIFRDQQFFEPAGKTVSIYANGKKFTANGLEMELRYLNPHLIDGFLNLNYIAGNKEDKIGEHYNFKYIPKYTLAAGLSRNIKNLSLSCVLNLKGATKGPNGTIDPMYMINANIGYQHFLFKTKIIHSLSVKNITNSDFLIPEYVRRTVLNSVPYGYFRSFVYSLKFQI